MSHRVTTYQTSSPTQEHFGNLPSYPFPSNNNSANVKHHAQFAHYSKDRSKNRASEGSLIGRLWYSRAKAVRDLKPIPEKDIEDIEVKEAKPVNRLRLIGHRLLARRKYILSRYPFYLFITVSAIWVFLQLWSIPWLPAYKTHEDMAVIPRSTHRQARSTQMNHAPSRKIHFAPEVLTPRPALPASVMKKSARNHTVSRGTLVVDPENNIHPIHQLIRDGRAEWDAKNARQSKTLAQAVQEYIRRYNMQPPKGFDKWWDYVCDHKIHLPDEYDQIITDIKPYHALSPSDLRSRVTSTSKLADTYTLRLRKGIVRTLAKFDEREVNGATDRLQGQVDLLKPVAQWIDDFEAVFSVHDTPRNLVGWDHKRELLEHVDEHEYWDSSDEIDLTLKGWRAACPPGSPMRTLDGKYSTTPSVYPSTSVYRKTFISDHSSRMDICQEPQIIPLHGVLADKEPKVEPLTPIFSLSKTSMHSDVLGIPTEQWVDPVQMGDVPAWGQRGHEKLLWRGSNTGSYYDSTMNWRLSHRLRLLEMTNPRLQETEEKLDLDLIPSPRGMKGASVGDAIEFVDWDEANRHYMDLAFTGEPSQCNVEDGTYDEMREAYRFVEPMTHLEALSYKYVLDVDGNAWSARFKRLLTSGALIFKANIMPEWWNDRMQPWVHYVPVQTEYSDLYDILAFFRGGISSGGAEQDLARDIAAAGRQWSIHHWRKEDMTAYMFRLYLEWARLMQEKRNDADFVYDASMERTRVD